MIGAAALTLATAALCLGAARPAASAPFVAVEQAGWSLARAELARWRRDVPGKPHVTLIHVRARGPAGTSFEGRGAVAVAPGRALRMILVGPAGRTALDLWADDRRHRVSVPDLDVVESGTGEARFPVALLRDLLVEPFAGRLLAAGRRGDERVFVLRREGPRARALEVRVRPEGGGKNRYTVARRDALDGQSVTWRGVRAWPSVGDELVVRHPKMGVELRVELESLSQEAPDAAAFDEPLGGS